MTDEFNKYNRYFTKETNKDKDALDSLALYLNGFFVLEWD